MVRLLRVLVLIPACVKAAGCPARDPRTDVRSLNPLCLGPRCPLDGQDCGVRAVQREIVSLRETRVCVAFRIIAEYDDVLPTVSKLKPDLVIGMACDRYAERGARDLLGLVAAIPIPLGPGCKDSEIQRVYSGDLQKKLSVNREALDKLREEICRITSPRIDCRRGRESAVEALASSSYP